jgi:hypothetical protein
MRIRVMDEVKRVASAATYFTALATGTALISGCVFCVVQAARSIEVGDGISNWASWMGIGAAIVFFALVASCLVGFVSAFALGLPLGIAIDKLMPPTASVQSSLASHTILGAVIATGVIALLGWPSQPYWWLAVVGIACAAVSSGLGWMTAWGRTAGRTFHNPPIRGVK